MARRGVGSNQYKTRASATPDLAISPVDLVAVARQETTPEPLAGAYADPWTAEVRQTSKGLVLTLESDWPEWEPAGIQPPIVAADPDQLVEEIQRLEYEEARTEPDHARWLAAMSAAVAVPGISNATLERLGHSAYHEWTKAAASSPYATPELLIDLCGNSHSAVTAIQNPNCPPELVVMSVKSNNSSVQQAAVRNPKCPVDVLEEAIDARTTFLTSRWDIAQRADCTPKMFDRLANDTMPMVRRKVASNPACPPGVLEHLLQDEDPKVRSAAAENPNCPEEYRHLARVVRADG
jgi:hypothetical protein